MFNHDFFLAWRTFSGRRDVISQCKYSKILFHCKKCDNDWFIISEEIRGGISSFGVTGFQLLFGRYYVACDPQVMLRLAPAGRIVVVILCCARFSRTLPSLQQEVDFLFPAFRPGRAGFAFGIQGRSASAGGGHWRV